MRELIEKLNYYTMLYDKGTPAISDKEWDDLYFQLKKEEEKTGIIYPDSPTQSIYYTTVAQLNKVEHNHPMLSLDKTKNIDEVDTFLHNNSFVGMFKMDGLTCSLTYEDGKLIQAETRGNGLIGEDIFHNVKVIKNIPQVIPYKDKICVDGEIICRKDNFEPFAEEYKNPRNFAAGSIRLLSSQECSRRNLSFIAWEMIEGYEDITDFSQRLIQLDSLGFEIVPFVFMERGQAQDVLYIFENQFKEEHNIYPIDGYVFKFNDVEYGKAQGQTGHHFKNAIAYKLYDELYDTKLKYIQWTMGRTGVLTPVAVFEPVDIDGSTIEKASLHNVSVMRQLLGDCAYFGEPLKIYKANQIIPQIAEAGPKYDYGYVIGHGGVSAHDVIERCPICGGEVEYITSSDGVINAYCSNPHCEGKLINRLDHFCGKKGLDIKGISKATFEKLIDWGWLGNIEEVFSLSNFRNEWITKPGFGIKSVDKMLQSIEDAKHTTLDAFISAIGIPLIGRAVAKDLINYFETYEDFRNAIKDKTYNFAILDNFGEEMNYNLKNFDYSEFDRISKFLIFESSIVNNNIINNNLEGKTIVITGKLTNFKNRAELKSVIESHGGKVVDSISAKTDMLINNDINSTSSKNKAAQARNIPILSEADFISQYIEK